jgi:hypothetical protein
MIPRNVRLLRVKPPSIGGLTRLQRFCEGYGLPRRSEHQAVRKCFAINSALAAEGYLPRRQEEFTFELSDGPKCRFEANSGIGDSKRTLAAVGRRTVDGESAVKTEAPINCKTVTGCSRKTLLKGRSALASRKKCEPSARSSRHGLYPRELFANLPLRCRAVALA